MTITKVAATYDRLIISDNINQIYKRCGIPLISFEHVKFVKSNVVQGE